MTTKKRMGGLRLSDFGSQATSEKHQPAGEHNQETATPAALPKHGRKSPSTDTQKSHAQQEERLVTVNIKIPETQQTWLADTAKRVRQNNEAPVPASERVYPQHLIQTAIALLQSTDLDWENIKNVTDLKQALDL